MREIAVKIEKMAFGGAGFGRVEGKACFVPFTAPGDMAKIRVRSEKRSYLEGELLELLESSSQRTTPPCPVFGMCGGCHWQHLSYKAQLAAKQEIFTDLLWRSGRVEGDRILPIMPAPEPFGYRSRVQLKLRSVAGASHMGFYRGGSHFVVDIPQRCAIAHPAVNRVIGELHSLMAVFPEPHKVPQIDVAVGDDHKALVIVHYIGDRHGETVGFLGQNRHIIASADGIFLQSGRKETLTKVAGVESLAYRLSGDVIPEVSDMRLSFSRGGFSQVNYQQNLALIATVVTWSGLTGNERVLDLYCGNGNFSVPLSRYVAKITGLEEYAPSIDDAVRNCGVNGVKNATFHCLDAAAGVKKLAMDGEKFDVVLLDPPRTGAADVVAQIPALAPRAILYISCDPATLARDIGILRKSGYGVVKSRPVDMFPQTYHMESVTMLVPSSSQS